MYFSIVCPAYNVEDYIAECIESVISQSFSDWEMIIINDESTDDTCNTVSRFLNDNRISLYSISHSGQTIARDYGIDKAKGNYIVFLDADDCLHKDTLSILYENATKYHFDIFSFRMKYFHSVKDLEYIDNQNLELKTFFKNEILKYYYGENKTMSLCGNAIKRNLVVNGFKAVPQSLRTIRFCEDFVTIFEIIKLCSSSMVFDVALYYYRINPKSVSHTKLPSDRTELTAAYEHVYKEFFEIEKSDHNIIDSTKVFLSYLPIMLVVNSHTKKHFTFLKARKMFLFKTFTLNNKWESHLLRIMVFAMKYKLFILFSLLNLVYLKKYLE